MRPRFLQPVALAVALFTSAACESEIRSSLNDVLDRAEDEMDEAHEIYTAEIAAYEAEMDSLPACRGTGFSFRITLPRREDFETDDEYYVAAEQCRRKDLIDDLIGPLRTMVRTMTPRDAIQGVRNDRAAMEPMTDAELVNLGPTVRNLYSRWDVDAAEAAVEHRREQLERDLETYMENLREQIQSR